VHSSELISNTATGNPAMERMLHGMSGYFSVHGAGVGGLMQAYGSIYATLMREAAVLAYRDTNFIMGVVTLSALPLLLLTQRPKPGIHMGH
jgi:hypothetical protein